jgi:hypothetical protein
MNVGEPDAELTLSPFSCRSSWIYLISCSTMELLDSSGMLSHASFNGVPGIWDMIIQCRVYHIHRKLQGRGSTCVCGGQNSCCQLHAS